MKTIDRKEELSEILGNDVATPSNNEEDCLPIYITSTKAYFCFNMGRSPRRDTRHSRDRRSKSRSHDHHSRSHDRRSRSRDRRSRSRDRRSRSRSIDRYSHSRDRRSRSRSRDKERYHHHDRSHHRSSRGDGSSKENKFKDTYKATQNMKLLMRSSLMEAESSEASAVSKIKIENFDISVEETISRHRDIERIEEEGFRPSVFISSAGGAGGRIKKEDPTDRAAVIEKKQDAHSQAMFGPRWRDQIKKEDDSEDNKSENNEETPSEPSGITAIANPDLFANPEERQARWLKLYRERRAAVLKVLS
ncbi:hypothetical protein AB6A40_006464 [Gnathostoma spinigerum]|uniref:Uncharacterized protein n=1 Tax=Gnathostoma spinigerum TaxID=75299 RepID=A0ABD6EU27_9BILA